MKKLITKLTCILMLICMMSVGAFVACNGGSNDNQNDVVFTLKLNQTRLDTTVGDFNTIKVTNIDSDAVVTWSSSDQSVASVDENGSIESLKEGTAKITATYSNYTADCTVNVSFGMNVPQLVIKNATNNFVIGKSQTAFPFEVSVLFNGREYKDVSIQCSSARNVVEFDANGNMFAKSVGTEEVVFDATWRGYTKERFPSLSTKISVTVADEVLFWVNGVPENEITIYSLAEHKGIEYGNQCDFVVTGEYNGQTINKSDIVVTYPEFISYENEKITAIASGNDKIYLSYTVNGVTLQSSVKINVERIVDDYENHIDYFSSNTGTYKDVQDEWKNKSVVETVFEGFDETDYNLSSLRAYQGRKQLTIEDGKLLGLDVNYSGAYQTSVTFETDRFTYNVKMTVYGLVLKEAEDLKNLELKVVANDSPRTWGLDETQVTCIDGYVALLNNIDAKDITIDHSALYYRYGYRKADGSVVTKTITPERYMYATHNRTVTADHITGKFGFIGHFDGRGNTIYNLDVSTESVDTIGGAGLFGYAMGNFTVENVAFKNLNCSNSCGIVNQSRSFGGHSIKTDPLGLRIGNPTWRNVYIHLSKDTVNPQGAFMKDGAGHMYNAISNVVIDATEVKLGSSTSGGLFANLESAACPYNESNSHYYSSTGVYIISPEVPAFYTKSVKVVGRNHASDEDLLRLPLNKLPVNEGVRYSPDFYTYSSYAEFASGDNDFSTFSDAWSVFDYPVYKTSKEIIVKYDGAVKYDDSIIVSSTSKIRNIELFSFTETNEITDVVFTEVDTNKLSLENKEGVGEIKLFADVTQNDTATIKVTYKLNGEAGEILVKVTIMPSLITVDDEQVVSAISFAQDIKGSMLGGQTIVSVKQTIVGGTEKEIVVTDGVVSELGVKIASDYSDVVSSKVLIETTDLKYEFTNVKVYSHIIRTAEDLRIFEQKDNPSDIKLWNGYYILGNNIDASGMVMKHATITTSSMDRFTGVLDGRGYAIENFEPRDVGLLRMVRSESGSHVEIKNIAFLNVKTYVGLGENAKDNSGFAIFAKQINAVGTDKAVIKNVHVDIEKTITGGWPDHSMYKGLFAQSKKMDCFTMENVYINIGVEDSPLGVYQNSGTIVGQDEGLIGTTEAQRKASNRFKNVVTISELNPCVFTDVHGTDVTKLPSTGYFAYAENMIGENGKIYIPSRDENGNNVTTPEHPVVSDNPEKASYIYYGVYKYAEEQDVPEDKASIFTGTGLWKLVDKEIEIPGEGGAEPTTTTVKVLKWVSEK